MNISEIIIDGISTTNKYTDDAWATTYVRMNRRQVKGRPSIRFDYCYKFITPQCSYSSTKFNGLIAGSEFPLKFANFMNVVKQYSRGTFIDSVDDSLCYITTCASAWGIIPNTKTRGTMVQLRTMLLPLAHVLGGGVYTQIISKTYIQYTDMNLVNNTSTSSGRIETLRYPGVYTYDDWMHLVRTYIG